MYRQNTYGRYLFKFMSSKRFLALIFFISCLFAAAGMLNKLIQSQDGVKLETVIDKVDDKFQAAYPDEESQPSSDKHVNMGNRIKFQRFLPHIHSPDYNRGREDKKGGINNESNNKNENDYPGREKDSLNDEDKENYGVGQRVDNEEGIKKDEEEQRDENMDNENDGIKDMGVRQYPAMDGTKFYYDDRKNEEMSDRER